MSLNRNTTMGKLWGLLRTIAIHPIYLLIPLSLSLCAAILDGASMSLLIPILTGFLQKSFSLITDIPFIGRMIMLLPESIMENDRYLFLVLLGVFATTYIVKHIFRFCSIVSLAYFAQRSLHHLRKTLFARYLTFGKLYFDTTNVGHHHTLLLEFTRKAMHPLVTVDKCINGLFSIFVYLTVMIFISWRLTIFALPIFLILHTAMRTIMTKIRQTSRGLSQRGAELGKQSTEILSNIALVKSHRTESLEQSRYTKISDRVARLDCRVQVLQGAILPLQEVIVLLVAMGIFLGALFVFGRDHLGPVPALIVYFYVVLNLSSKFGLLLSFQSQLAAASSPINEVLKVFQEEGKFFVTGGRREFHGLQQGITFRNLTFAYATDRDVLHDVSLVIRAKRTTAIVGPTGAGKSTLIHLLMRYYDCPSRSIFLDEVDIREFQLDSYLARIALVSQDTLLFHDTLRNNITYGLTDVPEEILQNVVARARLGGLIEQLPLGLDTPIGDRGVQLSGGEKQRVSIARALLKNAEILILDEATSALDSQTENLIQEAINDAMQNRTGIVIAHRLSTIKHADEIVVLKDGCLAEQGTLQDLLQLQGVFARLWKEQSF